MAKLKRILVVDDHFEMLDFLRSMLELSSQNYDVDAVPSAEEGLFELRRKDFDLVITDVRLPGMSGFEFIRAIKRIKPTIPTIMITAYSSEQGRLEAEELGVRRYFQKPLDTDEILAAVHMALYGEPVVHVDEPADARDVVLKVPEEVARRLETLRVDTGSTGIALGTSSGRILLQLGQGPDMGLPNLSKLVAANLENSFLMTRELGGSTPITIQYHAGDKTELYIANVGRDYFLAISFDVQTRRGRMGTIWVFAQRAIKDLLAALPRVEHNRKIDPATDIEPDPASDKSAASEGLKIQAISAAEPELPASVGAGGHPPVELEEQEGLSQTIQGPAAPDPLFTGEDAAHEASSGLDASRIEGRVGENGVPFKSDQLADEGTLRETTLPDEMAVVSEGQVSAESIDENAVTPEEDAGNGASHTGALGEVQLTARLAQVQDTVDRMVDLDAFWYDAIADDRNGGSNAMTGFSWEEAKRRGLLPKQLNFEGRRE